MFHVILFHWCFIKLETPLMFVVFMTDGDDTIAGARGIPAAQVA